MRAIVVDRWLEPAELALREAPEPALRPGTLLVDVKAAGCNFFDILMCRGTYQVKPPFPFVPGAEVAGVVARGGRGRRRLRGGRSRVRLVGPRRLRRTRVGAGRRRMAPARCDELRGGRGASRSCTRPRMPALVHRAALQRGETLLVHAAAGGVGVAAVQIGKALGARVIATAGGAGEARASRSARAPTS